MKTLIVSFKKAISLGLEIKQITNNSHSISFSIKDVKRNRLIFKSDDWVNILSYVNGYETGMNLGRHEAFTMGS